MTPGIGNRLLERSWQRLLQGLPISRPAHLKELIGHDAGASLPVALYALLQPLSVQRLAVAHHQRRLEQSHGVNELRHLERELESDHATEGMPDDVCQPHAEMRQQCTTVVDLIRETACSRNRAAADVAATMVADQSVPISYGALELQRAARVGNECPVNADHWFARSGVLIFQRESVEYRSIHRLRPAQNKLRASV
jgi:hypothetical protein